MLQILLAVSWLAMTNIISLPELFGNKGGFVVVLSSQRSISAHEDPQQGLDSVV